MIKTAISGGILVITLDRPEARNALNADGYRNFDAALRAASTNADVKVILVHGSGGNFCSGQDLKEAAQMSVDEIVATPFYSLIENLGRFGKPAVAAVDGDAVGAGVTMLLHMDFVVASAGARFKTPFVGLGSTAEAGSSYMLSTVLGPRVAARMLYLGDWLSATDPDARGLVSSLSDEESAFGAAHSLCERIAMASAGSLNATKRLIVAAREESLSSAFVRERSELAALLMTPESRALMSAFRDRQAARVQ